MDGRSYRRRNCQIWLPTRDFSQIALKAPFWSPNFNRRLLLFCLVSRVSRRKEAICNSIFSRCFGSPPSQLSYRDRGGCLKMYVQGWAKEWSLGCVNSRPAARGSQEEKFTHPRDHSFAQPCNSRLFAILLAFYTVFCLFFLTLHL